MKKANVLKFLKEFGWGFLGCNFIVIVISVIVDMQGGWESYSLARTLFFPAFLIVMSIIIAVLSPFIILYKILVNEGINSPDLLGLLPVVPLVFIAVNLLYNKIFIFRLILSIALFICLVTLGVFVAGGA